VLDAARHLYREEGYKLIKQEAQQSFAKAWLARLGSWRFKASQEAYCKASIKRVMVRFNSLSERRISSILLMECSTVV
jgi:hypothetical protein